MNVASASQSCTYDGTLTPPATIPTKTGYTFKGWTVRGVPDGYTRLEYIGFAGTQYISTDFTPNQNTEIRAKYMLTSATTSSWIYGSGTNNPRITGYFSSSGSGNQRFGNSALSRSLPVNQINISVQNKNGHTLNGIFIAYPTVADFTSSGKFLIGAVSSTSTSTSRFKGRMYSLSIYDNGVLKFNFIPAKNQSNVVGMYDTVSKTFFTNAGSGTFTAGPVAQ